MTQKSKPRGRAAKAGGTTAKVVADAKVVALEKGHREEPEGHPILEVHEVSKSFRGRTVVDRVSFSSPRARSGAASGSTAQRVRS